MTRVQILELMDKKNKQIIELSNNIKEESEQLPDFHSAGRINNYIQNINVLYVELEILKNITV